MTNRRVPAGGACAHAALLAIALAPSFAAHAQGDGLTDQQREGRRVFAQNCNVCHLPPVRNAPTYGPALNRASAAGNDDLMRAFISNGSARMPAFKYHLNTTDIDALVAYLRTIPAPATAQTNAGAAQ